MMNIQSCSAAPFLDNTFKKDDMKTMHENWRAFIGSQKERSESMKRLGITLPSTVQSTFRTI